MREYIRHPADIPIEITKADSDVGNKQALNNISIGGLSCQTDDYFENGTIVKIRIDLVNPVFETLAKVVWCRVLENKFEIGVQYENENDEFKLHMVEQICHIEHYRNEARVLEGRNLTGEEAAQEWIKKYADKFP